MLKLWIHDIWVSQLVFQSFITPVFSLAGQSVSRAIVGLFIH